MSRSCVTCGAPLNGGPIRCRCGLDSPVSPSKRLYDSSYSVTSAALAKAQNRIDSALGFLKAAPDLGDGDYSKNKVRQLVRDMQSAYAALSDLEESTNARRN